MIVLVMFCNSDGRVTDDWRFIARLHSMEEFERMRLQHRVTNSDPPKHNKEQRQRYRCSRRRQPICCEYVLGRVIVDDGGSIDVYVHGQHTCGWSVENENGGGKMLK